MVENPSHIDQDLYLGNFQIDFDPEPQSRIAGWARTVASAVRLHDCPSKWLIVPALVFGIAVGAATASRRHPDFERSPKHLASVMPARRSSSPVAKVQLHKPAVSNTPPPKQLSALPLSKAQVVPLPSVTTVRHALQSPPKTQQPPAPLPRKATSVENVPVPRVVKPPQSPAPAVKMRFVEAEPIARVLPERVDPGTIVRDSQVQIKVTVATDGRVTGARPVSAGAIDSLTNAAMAAAQQWQFRPATLGGKTVTSEHLIVFRFHVKP